MNKLFLKDQYATLCALLILFSPTITVSEERSQDVFTHIELQEALNNPDVDYVKLDQKSSKLYKVISEISKWDDNQHSPLHQLKDHIENGFSIAEYQPVALALEYAEQVMQKNYDHLPFSCSFQKYLMPYRLLCYCQQDKCPFRLE